MSSAESGRPTFQSASRRTLPGSRAVMSDLPVMSSFTPILNSFSVWRIRVASAPALSCSAFTCSSTVLGGGTATVNHRLNSWSRS